MVSVILPNYNHADYLTKRIESIIHQTYSDIELIILDDHSTDNSLKIIDSIDYKNNKVHIVKNNTNSGSVFKQWQKGIQLANGEFIWIAESDDWCENSFLEEAMSVFNENKQIGIVYCDSYIFNESKKKIDSRISDFLNSKFKHQNWINSYVHSGDKEIKDALIYNCTIGNVSSAVFRKEAILNADPFNVSFKYYGDWYAYLKIAKESSIAYINKPLNYFRRHSNSTTFKAGKSALKETFLIYNWIINQNFEPRSVIYRQAFFPFINELYADGLSWNPLYDLKNLFPINKYLYLKMTAKLLKRKLRRLIHT